LRALRLGVGCVTLTAAAYSLYVTSLHPGMPTRVPMSDPEDWKFYAVIFCLTTVIPLISGVGIPVRGKRILCYASSGWSVFLIALFLNWSISPQPYVINPLRVSTLAIANLLLL